MSGLYMIGGRRLAQRNGLLIVGLCALFCGCLDLAAQKPLDVQSVGVIKVKGSDELRMEDISLDGRVLILNSDNHAQDPEMLLWDQGRRGFVWRAKPQWRSAGLATSAPSWGQWPPSIFTVDPRGRMLVASGFGLAILDSGQGNLRRVFYPPELANRNSPYAKTVSDPYLTGTVIARDKYSGLVAAAFNFGKWPRLFMLRPPWKVPSASWRVDRFVKALAWSPDGNTLAVLYWNGYNNNLKNVMPMHRGQPWPTLPDVALIDAKTGKTRLKFFSGDMETSIVFGPDGKFIYCAGYYQGTMRKWVVREFLASNGKMVRIFKKKGLKLRGNLAVSPDGRYLVADANSTRWSMGVILNDTYGYDRRFRFVILDTATGKVVFKHQQRVGDTLLSLLPTFAFSPNGKYLYVDPHLSGTGSPEIQVYSLRESH